MSGKHSTIPCTLSKDGYGVTSQALIHFLDRELNVRFEGPYNTIGEVLLCQILIWHGFWTRAGPVYHGTPERMISEEWNHKSRLTYSDADGAGAGATVVYDAGDVLEEPVMWTVSKKEDVFTSFTIAKSALPFRYQSSNTGSLHGPEDQFRKFVWLFHDNRAEPNIDRRWPCFQELDKVVWCLVI
jgi:hypothetical protein